MITACLFVLSYVVLTVMTLGVYTVAKCLNTTPSQHTEACAVCQ
jgi:hypothetical protein